MGERKIFALVTWFVTDPSGSVFQPVHASTSNKFSHISHSYLESSTLETCRTRGRGQPVPAVYCDSLSVPLREKTAYPDPNGR